MIIEALFNFFFGFLGILVNFIPSFDFGSIGGATAIVASLAAVSSFMPMGAFSLGVKVFVGINALKLLMSVINWIVQKIPTVE